MPQAARQGVGTDAPLSDLPAVLCFGAGQKWHCVEDVAGKWRIQKCKGPLKEGPLKEGPRKKARSLRGRGYDSREMECDCGEPPYRASGGGRRTQRPFGKPGNPRESMGRGQEGRGLGGVHDYFRRPGVFVYHVECHCDYKNVAVIKAGRAASWKHCRKLICSQSCWRCFEIS